MESEGPYVLWDRIISNTIELNLPYEVKIANYAYAEGRKSAEKDFNEILDLSKSLYVDVCAVYRNAPQSVRDFNTWKKARGIE